MKQNLILWIAAIIITFLAGYINSLASEDYPVSGTIGIRGQKVSYIFYKRYSSKNPYNVIVRSDAENISGVVEWRKAGSDSFKTIQMRSEGTNLHATFPEFQPLTIIEYRIKISDGDKIYTLPSETPVHLKFYGFVPASISVLYFISLFGGLLLSIRTGLEFFREQSRIGLFSIITLIFFFVYTLAIHPIKTTFELNILNRRVPFITELFDLQSVIFLLVWIAGMIISFKAAKPKLSLMIISVITLLVYLFVHV